MEWVFVVRVEIDYLLENNMSLWMCAANSVIFFVIRPNWYNYMLFYPLKSFDSNILNQSIKFGFAAYLQLTQNTPSPQRTCHLNHLKSNEQGDPTWEYIWNEHRHIAVLWNKKDAPFAVRLNLPPSTWKLCCHRLKWLDSFTPTPLWREAYS